MTANTICRSSNGRTKLIEEGTAFLVAFLAKRAIKRAAPLGHVNAAKALDAEGTFIVRAAAWSGILSWGALFRRLIVLFCGFVGLLTEDTPLIVVFIVFFAAAALHIALGLLARCLHCRRRLLFADSTDPYPYQVRGFDAKGAVVVAAAVDSTLRCVHCGQRHDLSSRSGRA
jgi:hypothetical protein